MQFSHIPASADVTWQLCYRQKVAGTYISTWGTWRKNPKASLIYFLCIGHGGDGAAGVSATAGGGGGGSGGQTQVMIPAFLVPDTLYYSLMVPVAATVSGAIYVSDIPFTSAAIGSSVFAYASGGGTATSGTAGGAGAVATVANMQAGATGIVALLAGQAGTAGGTPGGTALTYPTTGLLVTGGAGGGGTTSTGADIRASAPRPQISGSATTGVPGSNGVDYVLGAFLPSGGAGGRGGDFFIVGSAGGSGGIGCGGGGGGSGTPVGAGGEGGPGLIMIAQW